MPQSKKRDNHKHAHQDFIPHKKKKGSAKTVTIVFCTFLAIAIAWFAAGLSPIWLPVGAILGAAFGYFIGSQVDKAL